MPIPPLKNPQFRVRRIGERVVEKLRSGRMHPKLWRRLLANWLPILLGLIAVVGILTIAAFAWFSRDLPNPDKIIDRSVAQSTKIYARDGKTLLYEVHGPEKRTIINLQEIPDTMKEATIAIEDKDFYHHHGFALTGIAKAICHEAFGNLGGLCPPRGGSTITQQFIKNSILTSERTYTRKIKELVLSYQLEKKFTKDQILQLYLNEIPYGNSAYGVESAAQTYFGKSARDLTLAESAFLAALPQAPSYYSPYGNHVDELSSRKNLILQQMLEQGYISQAQHDAAKGENTLLILRPKNENIQAPHFVMSVREYLSQKYGETVMEQGGLKVTTTLNIDKQRIAEEVVEKYAEKNAKNYRASNAALVSLDTKTGQILAMVGSRDYFDTSIDGNVNVALRPRQPGSSFKPFVYLTAFKRGYTPETILFDLNTNFKTDTKDYAPKNYDSKEHGPVSMRQALAGSLNIPAVKTLYLAGIENVLDTATSFGYTTFKDRSRFGLSLVLGGGEVTLLEHTSAYATLAREGVKHPAVSILKVEDSRGKVLEQYEDRQEQVMDENTVRLVTSVLSDNEARAYIFGSKNYLTLPDRSVAAKTGTTNDYRDAWTLGYTPSVATGVWVGNNNNSEMSRGADGSVVAAPIWNEFMRRTVGGPAEPFKAPKPNSATKPILQGQLEGETKFKVDRYTGKLIPASCLDTYPAAYITEKTYRAVHDILFYVNKDDPNGPAPSNLSQDPQYERWEEPVRRWAQEHGYTDKLPAAESCDLRSPANQPTATFLTPQNGATVTDTTFTIQVSATGPRPIKQVEYFLDEKSIGTSNEAPYSLNYVPVGLESGFHDLRVEAHDDLENVGQATITVNYLASNGGTTTPESPPLP